jgi:hypothetical protein
MIARTAGTLCWNRLKLKRSLPGSDGSDRLWLATDVHTGESQVVEFLSPGHTHTYCPPHPLHPSLLSFYRFEGGNGDTAAIFAYHPLLETPPLSGMPAARVEPVTAVRWAMSIGQAAAMLHDAGLRAHGAIGPAQIRAAAETLPLLTGYPAAGDTRDGIPATQPPVPSDDIHGVAAVLYFLLTGHAFSSDDVGMPEFVIDDIRQSDGLSPTGWTSGWEKPLRSALASIPSLRPASMRALVDELGAVLQDSSERPAVETRPRPTRRIPSWHTVRGGRFFPLVESPAVAVEKVNATSAEEARIKRLGAEPDQCREAVATDVERANSSRADAERRMVDLEGGRSPKSNIERLRLKNLSLQLEPKRDAFNEQFEKPGKSEQKLVPTEQELEQRDRASDVDGPLIPSNKDSALPGEPNGRPAPICRCTLGLPNGRRLHLFCGQSMRFGRHAESDFVLVALARGRSPNVGASREISRKHFELQLSPDGLRIVDGWSSEGKASQQGVCIDGQRVPAKGAELRHGSVLSVTTRAPSGSVPHWRIALVPTPASAVRVGESATPLAPPFSAAMLRRMDDAPDDICIFLDTVTLRSVDSDEPANSSVALHRTPNGIAWVDGAEPILLAEGNSPAPGVEVVSVGRLVPFGASADKP